MTVRKYQEYSAALLIMWMDNIITDSEYRQIMDRLNVHYMTKLSKDEHTTDEPTTIDC